MIEINIPLQAYSKPRGQIGRYGNLTHSSGDYRIWQKQFQICLYKVHPDSFPDFFGIVYEFFLIPRKGRKQDLDNMVGAVNDCLVPHWIIDDNWSRLSRFAAIVKKNNLHDSINLYICSSKREFIEVLDEIID